MKYSLLEMTQTILSSLDSDEVNSISDTTEAQQVARVVRTAYFNIIARADLPEHRQIFSLDSSGDSTQPVLMIKPEVLRRVDWIKYNRATIEAPQDHFSYVTILPLQQFLDMVHQFNENDIDIESFTLNSHTFYFRNAVTPTYCTIVDDFYVVFDSYDNTVDTTLQSDKTMCYGIVVPAFTLADDFMPDLDDQQFALLLNEAKSLAFMELKQVPHEKAEQESKRQWRTLQRTKSLDKPLAFDQFPNFGRRV
jgi:hypothetical protein